jgi:maleylacetoacetate isomerase
VRLYSFFRSSASFRVRIALNLKGIDYETVPVGLPRDEHLRPKFLALNPQATVPTLEDDGVVLAQSLAIIEYLDARFPAPRLIPAEPVARARVQWLAQLIACEIHPLNNLRVRRHLANELALDDAGVERWQRHWIAEAFGPLEALVSQWSGGRYCFGDAVSVADVCLVPQVYNARRVSCDLAAYPTLVRIADGLAREPAFASAAPEAQPDAGSGN